VDSFAIGHGGAKVKLVLLYFLGLVALSGLPSPWHRKWNIWLPAGLAILHLVALAEHVAYCMKSGVPIIARTICLYHGLNSPSRLQHTHSSKAVISTILTYTGEGFDAGHPYLAIFPSWWLWLHTALFLGVAMMGVLVVHKAQKEMRFGEFLSLALVVFTLVKNGLDGGPLDTQTIAAIPYFAVLMGFHRKTGFALTGVLLLTTLGLSGTEFAFYDIWRFSSATLCFGMPLLIQRARGHGDPKSWVVVLLAVLPLILAPAVQYRGHFPTPRLPNSAVTIKYGLERLQKGWVISLVSKGELPNVGSSLFRVKEVRRGHRMWVTRVELLRDTTPFELCDLLSLNVFRQHVGWYQEPAYVTIRGPMKLPASKTWRQSELVTGYLEDTVGDEERLVLELCVGGKTNAASDALGTELYVARTMALHYRKPSPEKDWRKPER
jgi:hypothetical protein